LATGIKSDAVLTTYAPGEKFRLTLPGDTHTIEAMVTPDTLSTLAGDEYDRIGDDIQRGFCFHPDILLALKGEGSAKQL